MQNIDKIENDIIELIKNLEDCKIDDFLLLFNKIIEEFDRVFSKYEIDDFKVILSNSEIKTFRDLL
jgi:hypothetical protein